MNNAQAEARLGELASAMLVLIDQIITDPGVDMDESHGFYNLLSRARSTMTILNEQKIIRNYHPALAIKLVLKRMVIDFEEIDRISGGMLPPAIVFAVLRDLRFLSEAAQTMPDDFDPNKTEVPDDTSPQNDASPNQP